MLEIVPDYDGSVGPTPKSIRYERTFMNIDGQAQGIHVRIVPNDVDLGGSYFFQRSNWQ